MMRLLRTVALKRRRLSTWHVLVGSLMLWLVIFMYKYRPSLERLQRQFKHATNPNLILEEPQKSLNEISALLSNGEHLISQVKENINRVNEVTIVLG